MEKAAELLEKQTGIGVVSGACSSHCAQPVVEDTMRETGGDDFMLEIARVCTHDLTIAEAEGQ